MPHPTEIETFQTNIQSVPEMMAFVDDVAEDAEFQESAAGMRGDPLSVGLSFDPFKPLVTLHLQR